MNVIRTFLAATVAIMTLGGTALAHGEEHPEGIHIHDAYIRTSGSSGAVYFIIHNNTENDITITGATTDAADKAEFHANKEDANGVMQMIRLKGAPVPYGEMREFSQGSDHLMLFGPTRKLKDGDTITITLTFDKAAPVTFKAVVDSARKPGEGGMKGMDHGEIDHGDQDKTKQP